MCNNYVFDKMANYVKLERKSNIFHEKKPQSWACRSNLSSFLSESDTFTFRTGSLKLRPVLDFRMPTLATNGALLLPVEDITSTSRLLKLESQPPSCLRDVTHALETEIKAVHKRLTKLERSYYGVGKSLHNEIQKYATPLKLLIRTLGYLELTSVKAVHAAIKYGSDQKRYKGDPENVKLLKEVYTKLQTFVPDKFSDIIENCSKMLEILEKYCISFYNLESSIEVETALHYETQIRGWKQMIRDNLEKIRTLITHFNNRGVHYTMFSFPVATFCQRNECELVPLLLLFPEACTNIRTVLSIMTQWLISDANYSVFLQNDVDFLERQKDEQLKVVRDSKEHFHSVLFKISQLQTERTKIMGELENLRGKEESSEIEETYLVNKCNELELDMEFKEGRRDDLKNKPLGDDIECLAITWDNLNEEIRFLKENLPGLKRQLAVVQHRREWIKERRAQVDTLEKEIEQLSKEAKQSENVKKRHGAEYETIEKTLEVCRRLLLHKCSNDSVAKIYYDLPITTRNNKFKLPGISNGTDGALDKACALVVKHIGQDWMHLYRHLPFFPIRGSETIEKDIASIGGEETRGSKKEIANFAFSRWRRHHIRARTIDLEQGLKAIKRFDILKELDTILRPTPVEEKPPEYIPPELDPSLIPYYRDVIKLDQLIAAKKIQVNQLPDE